MKWISVNDGMPPEKDSIFAKYYGTEKLKSGMYRKNSDNVLVTIEFEDGTRTVDVCRTLDGKWNFEIKSIKMKVLYWTPMPEPYWNDADICGATGVRCSNCQPCCSSRKEQGNNK